MRRIPFFLSVLLFALLNALAVAPAASKQISKAQIQSPSGSSGGTILPTPIGSIYDRNHTSASINDRVGVPLERVILGIPIPNKDRLRDIIPALSNFITNSNDLTDDKITEIVSILRILPSDNALRSFISKEDINSVLKVADESNNISEKLREALANLFSMYLVLKWQFDQPPPVSHALLTEFNTRTIGGRIFLASGILYSNRNGRFDLGVNAYTGDISGGAIGARLDLSSYDLNARQMNQLIERTRILTRYRTNAQEYRNARAKVLEIFSGELYAINVASKAFEPKWGLNGGYRHIGSARIYETGINLSLLQAMGKPENAWGLLFRFSALPTWVYTSQSGRKAGIRLGAGLYWQDKAPTKEAIEANEYQYPKWRLRVGIEYAFGNELAPRDSFALSVRHRDRGSGEYSAFIGSAGLDTGHELMFGFSIGSSFAWGRRRSELGSAAPQP